MRVATLLRDWRKTHPSLQHVAPGGSGLTVALATDGDADSAPFPRSVLELRLSKLETSSVVPYQLTETITVANGYENQLETVAEAIAEALNRKSHHGEGAVIHTHRLVDWSVESDAGMVRTVRLEWEGEASW